MDQFDDKWQRRQERWARRQERRAQKQERRQRHSPMHGVLVGGIITTIGVIFLLDNLGILQFRDIWQYWPVILIIVGVARLSDAHGPAAIVFGAVVAGIGGLILADNLNLIYFDWRVVWPILLIAWGIVILFRPRRWGGGPIISNPPVGGVNLNPPPGSGSDSSNIGLWTIFGGGRRQIDSQDFRGGEISAIFGGFEVDLRHAAIAGERAMIDVTALFGGVEIRVPGTWTVEARGVGIFGGFGDETRPPRPGEVTREQRLIVTGTAAFGGVAIKN